MNSEAMKARLEALVAEGRALMITKRKTPGKDSVDQLAFGKWGPSVVAAIAVACGDEHHFVDQAKKHTSFGCWQAIDAERLLGVVEAAEEHYRTVLAMDADRKADDPFALVTRLCERFNAVARQLRARHDNRPTLNVTDEYDVQDLLHGLLLVFFEDVRAEEWTPSYAGGAGRMDFLLKTEQLVIETKMARQGLNAKKLGDELLIDIGRYKAHGDCKQLVCFVYDPAGHVRNPAAIENDLTKTHDGLPVHVFIRPQH